MQTGLPCKVIRAFGGNAIGGSRLVLLSSLRFRRPAGKTDK